MQRILILKDDRAAFNYTNLVYDVSINVIYISRPSYSSERNIIQYNSTKTPSEEYAINNKITKRFKYDWVIIDPEYFMYLLRKGHIIKHE